MRRVSDGSVVGAIPPLLAEDIDQGLLQQLEAEGHRVVSREALKAS